jgi:hypothetical protein
MGGAGDGRGRRRVLTHARLPIDDPQPLRSPGSADGTRGRRCAACGLDLSDERTAHGEAVEHERTPALLCLGCPAHGSERDARIRVDPGGEALSRTRQPGARIPSAQHDLRIRDSGSPRGGRRSIVRCVPASRDRRFHAVLDRLLTFGRSA